MSGENDDFDAIILAGGRSRRLGGMHKPDLVIGGRPVLQRVADAVTGAGLLVVVGPQGSAPGQAVVVREDPPGSGPVPALATGLPRVRAPWVALLAADLPFLRGADIASLREHAAGGDGAVLLDEGGREQWLVGVWRVAALSAALATYEGASLKGLLGPLQPARLAPAVPANVPPPWLDCDTMGDVEAARAYLDETAQRDREEHR